MNTNKAVRAVAVAVAASAMWIAPYASAAKDSGVLRLPFGESPVLAFSWGASQSGSVSSGGGGAGKVNVQDVSITRATDSQSPQIFKTVALGQRLPVVEIEVGTTKYKLEDVIVSSYSTGGAVDGKSPRMDNVSFNFGKITYTVDGISTCFDIVRNASC
jgi:type VI protein secretion system component Hcp